MQVPTNAKERLRAFLNRVHASSNYEMQLDSVDISEPAHVSTINSSSNKNQNSSSCAKTLWRWFITLVAIAGLVIAIIALLRRFTGEDVTGTWLSPGPGFVDPTGILGKIGQYYIDSGTQQVWFKSSTASASLSLVSSSGDASAASSTGWSRITDGNILGGDLGGIISNGTVQKVGGFPATYIAQGAQLAFLLNTTLQPGQNYTLPADIFVNSVSFPAPGSTATVRIRYTTPGNIEIDNPTVAQARVNVVGRLTVNSVDVGNVYAPLTTVVPGAFAIFDTNNQLNWTTFIQISSAGDTLIVNGTLEAKNITFNNVSIETYINNAVNKSVNGIVLNETRVREIVLDVLANTTLPLNKTQVEIIVQNVLANYTFPVNATLIQQIVMSTLANYTFNPNATLIQEIVLANLANFTFNPNVTLINELIWQALATINVTIPPPNVTLIRQIVDQELAAFNFSQNNFTLPERLVYGPLTKPIVSGTIPYFFDTSGRNITASTAQYFPGNNTFLFSSLATTGALSSATTISAAAGIISATSITAGTTISATGSITTGTLVNTPIVIAPADLTLAPIGPNIGFSAKNIVNANTITSSIGGTSVHTFTMTGNWNQIRVTNGGVTGNIRIQVAGGSNAGFMFFGFNGGNTDSGEQRDNTAKNRYRFYADQRGGADRLVIDMLGNSGTNEYISMGPLATSPVALNTGITSNANVDIVGRFRTTATTGAVFFIDYPTVNTNTGPYIGLGQHFTNAPGDRTGTKLKLLGDAFGIGVGGAALYYNAPSTGSHQFFTSDVSNAVPSVRIDTQGMIVTESVFAKNFHSTCSATVTGLSGFSGLLGLRFWKAGYHVLLELQGSDSNIFRCTNGGGCGIFGSTTSAVADCPGFLPVATSTGVYLPGVYPSNVYRVAFTTSGFLQITCSAGICGVAGGFNFGETIVDSGRSIISYFQIPL